MIQTADIKKILKSLTSYHKVKPGVYVSCIGRTKLWDKPCIEGKLPVEVLACYYATTGLIPVNLSICAILLSPNTTYELTDSDSQVRIYAGLQSHVDNGVLISPTEQQETTHSTTALGLAFPAAICLIIEPALKEEPLPELEVDPELPFTEEEI